LASPLTAVLERLFDDASLFPPVSRPMAEALRAHATFTAGPHGRLAGPFLCPATRLPELDACLASGVPAPASVGVVGYEGFSGWRGVFATRGLVQVEAPVGTQVPLPPGRVRLYVELAPRDDLDRSLDAIAAGGHRVKVRGTGRTRHAVPSCGWLAEVLVGCAARRLVLKVAGGADHPFRRLVDPGPHHGVVNLLAAAAAARGGAAAATVAGVLATEEPEAAGLAARVGGSREVVSSVATGSVAAAARELAARGLL
jgi:hypothetical protein